MTDRELAERYRMALEAIIATLHLRETSTTAAYASVGIAKKALEGEKSG